MKKYILTSALILLAAAAFCQETASFIGKQCPDVTLNIFQDGKVKKAKISDYRGKFLIIDFWATWCVPCINSLSRLNKIQADLGDKVQVLPMSSESRDVISKFIANRNKEQPFILPTAIDEQKLHEYFTHSFIPFTIILNKEGVVISMPNSEEVTEDNLRKIISDEHASIRQTTDNGSGHDFNPNQPLYSQPKFNTTGIYYSQLSRYNKDLPGMAHVQEFKDSVLGGRITVLNVSVASLYGFAFGKFGPATDTDAYIDPSRMIFLTKDSDQMIRPKSTNRDDWFQKYAYSYELVVPNYLTEKAHSIMVSDLERFFPYTATREKRRRLCWVLQTLGGKKYPKSQGGTENADVELDSVNLRNSSLTQFDYIMEKKFLAWTHLPFVDETGINYDIDLQLEVKVTDPVALKAALNAVGLDLKKEERLINIVVIRDKSANATAPKHLTE